MLGKLFKLLCISSKAIEVEPERERLFEKMPIKADTDYAAGLSDSELDELVSEEEGDEDVKPNLSDAKVLLKGSLERPRHSTLNTKQLHDMIHMGTVDLDAAYQRDVVWSPLKMVGLIQSLFLNYYIPPIIFAVEKNEEGDETRICIDGKQRCSSILDFMDGKIAFVSPNTKQRFWYNKFGAQKHGRQLPESLKRRFDQISIQVVEYDNIKDEQQRDIFQRVQMGVALSAPEKLQAIPGPWTEWIIELQKKYITEEGTLGDQSNMEWETKRGRPFQALVALIMLAYEPRRQGQPTSPSMAKFLARADPPDPHFKRKIEMTLSLFVNIVVNFKSDALQTATSRIAPVEIWFAALLIFTRMGVMSVQQLAIKIGEMRTYIRARNVDIRTNTRVVNQLHDWLSTVPKKRQPGQPVAAEEYSGDDVDAREIRALKRNRQAEEEDPSYLGQDAALPRGANPAPTTRAKVQKTAAAVAPTRPARIALPTTTVARPPPSAMDAPAAYPTPSTAQAVPSVNPYTQAYTVGSTATQRLAANQAQQPNRSPNYPQAYQQPTAQPQRQYSQQELAQFHAMRQAQAQQKPQGNQWATNQTYGR